MKNNTRFDELIDELQGKLHALAYAILLSHDEALDVVQEALIKAWLQEGFEKPGFQRRAWLFRVVRNLALNRKRSLMRLWNWMKKRLYDEHDAERLEVVDEMLRQESLRALGECMQKLSLKERETLALFYGGDFTCEEIAELTDTPKGTITSRLKRAREKLAEFMQEEGEGHAG